MIEEKIRSFMDTDLRHKTAPERFALNTVKILFAILRDLADGNLSLRAMSLVYTTLITMVPLLAISFSVLKGFGVHNQIEPWLLSYLAPLGEKAEFVTNNVISFVDNIKVGVLGAIGLALLIYSVIALMQKIESSFNYIWRVSKSRSLARRFSDYLSVLLFGPFLIFLSAGLTTAARQHSFVTFLTSNEITGAIFSIASVFIPYLVMTAGFAFFYIFMPNTRVKLVAALTGGLFAALMWKLMGWAFSNLIAASATYVAVYAAFATLIVFMVWIYLSWLLILMGANIAFYVQNPKYVRIARKEVILSNRMRIEICLSIMENTAKEQYKSGKGVSAEGLAQDFQLPVIAVQNMIDALEYGGILSQCERQKSIYYVPSRPLDDVTLNDVIAALDLYFEKRGIDYERFTVSKNTKLLMQQLEKAESDILKSTVKKAFIQK